VVLLMGGFIFAKAIEAWGLHERIALHTVRLTGGSPSGMIAGFMFAAAILSMWISNSATSIMMMPIVLGYLNQHNNTDISFAQWMMVGIPAVILLVPIAWFVLTRWVFQMPTTGVVEARKAVSNRLSDLGNMTVPEKRTLLVFSIIAILWAFRRPLNALTISYGGELITPLSGLTDHMTAIFAVLLCFLVPAGSNEHKGERLLNWKSAEQIPWGVLLLFGGGMSLAQAISSTGLSTYLGESLSMFASYPIPVVIFLIAAVVLALTEVTSNIATASALMPVLGALALETGLPLEMMAAPIALAASCAFMLPMATGPNAVVFATGEVSLSTMARSGARLNLIAVFVITVISYFIAPLAFR